MFPVDRTAAATLYLENCILRHRYQKKAGRAGKELPATPQYEDCGGVREGNPVHKGLGINQFIAVYFHTVPVKKKPKPALQRYAEQKASLRGNAGAKGLSKKVHRADALALGAEEGRDKLRKAAGRSKYPVIRRYPNGGTHSRNP